MKTILHPDYWAEIPAGKFLTGVSDAQRKIIWARLGKQPALPPQKTVWLDRFYIARYKITAFQQLLFQKGIPANELPGALEIPDRNGIGHLHSEDIAEFCRQLGGRVPTTLEWEKAARGTDGRLYPWGNDWEHFRQGPYRLSDCVDAYPHMVSPYGVWGLVHNVPEVVELPETGQAAGWNWRNTYGPRAIVRMLYHGDEIVTWVLKGYHPKEVTEDNIWYYYMLFQGGYGEWIGFRPALDGLPVQQEKWFCSDEQVRAIEQVMERVKALQPPRSFLKPAQ